MSKLILLKSANTLHDIAAILGVKPAHLAYNLYKKTDAQKYKQFVIPKKNGGTRTINAPIADFKIIQRNLAKLLAECAEESVIYQRRLAAHGFWKGRSILTNAHQHRRHRFVFNIDLEDFFGSINFGRVRGFFIADQDFGLPPAVATVIAQIVCFQNSLPQGGPASPVVSNLIGNILDTHLTKLASSNGCLYTRYADDITFSTNLPTFPISIAVLENDTWTSGGQLKRLIEHSGFAINASKVRMQHRDSQQSVTGLMVNSKANTFANYRSSLRAKAFSLFSKGSFTHDWNAKNENGTLEKKSVPGKLEELQGMFAHVAHVDNFNADVRGLANTQAPGRYLLYRRFFFYSQFFAAPSPVLLCEGKTDNVYLVHAIRARAPHFPSLAAISTAGEISLLIRLFKYVNRNAGKILQLSGGQGELGKFISNYLKDVHKHFKAPGVSQHPVIVVVDFDDGGKKLYAAASSAAKKALSIANAFEHVAANLYLVPTPLVGTSTESRIEDCFSASTLATLLGTKAFNYKSPKIDESKEYGKSFFAEYVVKPNASSTDFSGFDPLLARIRDVLSHYASLPK